MLNIASPTTAPTAASKFGCAPVTRSKTDADSTEYNVAALKLLNDTLAPRRRVVHSGDVIYRGGDRFDNLYVLNSGFFKIELVGASAYTGVTVRATPTP